MRQIRKQKHRKMREKGRKKLSKKQIFVICGIFVIIIAIVAAVWIYTSKGSASGAEKNTSADNSREEKSDSQNGDGEDKNSETDSGAEQADGESSASDLSGGGSKGDSGEDSEPVFQEGVHGLTLPYSIPGSNLVVRGIASYDGIYLEDGSDEEISGVTVMLLQNAGDTEVEYASVTVSRDGTQLQFEASALPAGAMAVVQEQNRTPFQEGTYADCSATVAEIDEFEMSENQVQVEENEDQSLTITNLTDKDIPAVRIFYKFYMEEENAYVGGITYTAKVTNLKAGDSQEIIPSHYLQGSSRIIMVRTYDTTK